MSVPRLLLVGALLLFAGIGVVAITKKDKPPEEEPKQEISEVVKKVVKAPSVSSQEKTSHILSSGHAEEDFPNIDRIFQLFTTGPSKLPIVETVEYSSSVSWLKGRPAWIADYAVYYNTSRHFIARSLHGKPEYDAQKIIAGSRFNVFLEAECKRHEISLPSYPMIDSLKWARKYRPDLPRHTLQSLREVYGIAANQAHRALDDVIILHKVFSFMIDDLPMETVLQLLSAPVKTSKMPFGKHQGKPLSEVPKDYIKWLKESGAFDKPDNKELFEAFSLLGLA